MIHQKPYPSILLLSFLGISSVQTQPDFAGISWLGWLLILLLVILLVWWLITRQVKHSPSIDETAVQHADEHTTEHSVTAEMAPAPVAEPLAMLVEAPQPVTAVLAEEPTVPERLQPAVAPGVVGAIVPAAEPAALPPVEVPSAAGAEPAGIAVAEAISPVEGAVTAVETESPFPAAPPAPDNLEIIEGIGPKIASLLRSAGIVTFAQLRAAEQPRLVQILRVAGLRVNDPTTWPEQARLAASGDWEGLQKLQGMLKGGRRVENL